MIIQVMKIVILWIISLWGSIYIGSLTPTLWKQKNYRGAVGAAILAGLTLFLPLVFSLLRGM
ncbi:hypothetical protein [Paenibacillus sp. FSL K6-2859]|uniref:hypothetical protein n=1 Tax=Paenibacillus sp. FSL K6-2859 TaxID=2921482 RepID=UPI0030F7B03D